MAIYYKYYSYLPLEFFEEPTLKISSVTHLNDPFESLLPSDIKEYINEVSDLYSINVDNKKEEITDTLHNAMTLNGIISFSETQRNLLMWAHYADEHKGLCIGYESNELFPDETRENLNIHTEIRKVNYDTVRHEKYGETYNINNAVDMYEYIISNVMLTKGESWIYEKEHRYIIPNNLADYIKIKKGDFNKNLELQRSYNVMLNAEMMFIAKPESDNDENITLIPSPNEKKSGFGYLSKYKEASYFLKINPQSIKRIYFGCRTPDEYIMNVKKRIEESKVFNKELHISKMQLDKTRFELYIPPIELDDK